MEAADAALRALNAELSARVVEHTAELEAVNRWLREMGDARRAASEIMQAANTLEISEQLARVCELIGHKLEVGRVVAQLFADLDSMNASWSRTDDGACQEDRWFGPSGSSKQPVHEHPKLVFNDLAASDSAAEVAYGERIGARAVLLWPITCRGELVGLFSAEVSSLAREWTKAEVLFFDLVVAEIGVLVDHLRAYERERLAAERLREADQAKRVFLAAVSHELRTPLTSILGYLEMLIDGEVEELGRETLRMITIVDRNSRRLLGLVDDLLTSARVDAGRLRLAPVPTDVGALIERACDTVLPRLEGSKLKLDIDVPWELPEVDLDAEHFERVLVNLLTNAVKHTPPGGTVTIFAEPHGENVRFVVRDTGDGIPAEDQARVFERFFRSRSTRQVEGSGLGLFIVKEIVSRHGGAVTLRSTVGAGTEVECVVPIHHQSTSEPNDEEVV